MSSPEKSCCADAKARHNQGGFCFVLFCLLDLFDDLFVLFSRSIYSMSSNFKKAAADRAANPSSPLE